MQKTGTTRKKVENRMHPSQYDVLSDDAEEFAKRAKAMCDYLRALGALWDRHRNSTLALNREPGRLYKTLPIELVVMLDEVLSTCLCEAPQCLEPCHRDWDFCEAHGKMVGT